MFLFSLKIRVSFFHNFIIIIHKMLSVSVRDIIFPKQDTLKCHFSIRECKRSWSLLSLE